MFKRLILILPLILASQTVLAGIQCRYDDDSGYAVRIEQFDGKILINDAGGNLVEAKIIRGVKQYGSTILDTSSSDISITVSYTDTAMDMDMYGILNYDSNSSARFTNSWSDISMSSTNGAPLGVSHAESIKCTGRIEVR